MIAYSLGFITTSTNTGASMFEITSTEEEKKSVTEIQYWDVVTDEVYVSVWLEREQIVENIPLNIEDGLNPVRKIPLSIEIPVGETLVAKLTPQLSGNHGVIHGAVLYTIAK